LAIVNWRLAILRSGENASFSGVFHLPPKVDNSFARHSSFALFAPFAPLRLCEKLPVKLCESEESWFLAKAQRRKGRKGAKENRQTVIWKMKLAPFLPFNDQFSMANGQWEVPFK
jgi:hypothetical protein